MPANEESEKCLRQRELREPKVDIVYSGSNGFFPGERPLACVCVEPEHL
jgi:hypothetical protein